MQKDFGQQHTLTISFCSKVGDQALVLGKTFQNPFGENITISRFKYYVSNIVLIDDNDQSFILSDGSFLIDEADESSKVIKLLSPVKNIKAIGFLLGVDSSRNVSGVQTGALDPMNGMFWTWNTGYIYAKLEGQSDSSHAPAHYFAYHIGGYKQGKNATREIILKLPASLSNKHSSLTITANIDQWFKSKNTIRIAQVPVCESVGVLALRIADNYSTMFTIADTKL
jgi:hypothetical protein